MKFRITIRKEGEATQTRVVEAESRFKVYEDVHNEGGFVVTLTELSPRVNFLKVLSFTIGTGVKTEERITFTKNLAAMLGAGLTLSRALSVIERQTHNRSLKKIVTDLEDQVKKGTGFHEGLARHPKVFSKLFVAMTMQARSQENFQIH